MGLRGLVGLLAWSGAVLRAADDEPPSEYAVKATLAYKLPQFIEWPAKVFANRNAPIVIGVLGDNPFEGYLDNLVKSERVDGHPLAVRYCKTVEEAQTCHLLFIARSETPRLESIFTQLRGRPVLTIGDSDAFIRAGGMMRFMLESGKVRMGINLEEIKASGITISSKLARQVTRETRDPKEKP